MSHKRKRDDEKDTANKGEDNKNKNKRYNE